MSISRITGAAKGRSPAVRHNGIVYAVATAGSNSSCVAEQRGRRPHTVVRSLQRRWAGFREFQVR